MKNKKLEERIFCGQCGKELDAYWIPAEECKMEVCDSGGSYTAPLGRPYSTTNGERQYGIKYKCPKYEKGFMSDNGHDCFIKDNMFTKKDI